MRLARWSVLLLCLEVCTAVPTLAQVSCASQAVGLPAEAVPRPVTTQGWSDRVERSEQALAEANPLATHLVFMGDSLTAGWPRAIWDREWQSYGALNLGVPGDRTYGLLWRLQNGRWGAQENAFRPRLVVLNIGTNNIGAGRSGCDISRGVRAIVRYLRDRSPRTAILLLSIWPRRGDARIQHEITVLNAALVELAAEEKIDLLDLSPQLRSEDGGPAPELFRDGLHPTPAGYERIAAALRPVIARLMASQAER